VNRLTDWLWFHVPVITTRARLLRRAQDHERNAFELGRDYEGAVREGQLS
jgi:hypothetical protein